MKRVFEKFLLVFMLIFSLNILNNAQTFSVAAPDTVLNDNLGSEIIFEFIIHNTSNDTLNLYFLRSLNDLPDGWTSSLCFETCLAPHVDSIVTNVQYGSSPILVGESRDFSVHVFLMTNEGEANIELKIANVDNPDEFINYNLTASTTVTSVKENVQFDSFELYQNYPNPFNPSTNISFILNDGGRARLSVFDILGNKISTITDKYYSSGFHQIEFSAGDLSSGIYFYKLEVNNLVQVKKMVIGK